MHVDPSDGCPLVGKDTKMLGVRVGVDVRPDQHGRVMPGRGMSVIADDNFPGA